MLQTLLYIAPALAFWRTPCVSPVTVDRIDPIVDPGMPSGHMHTIMGGSNISMNTTFDDLRASSCTSCMVAEDLSAYWTPTLYYQGADGTFESVAQLGGATIYYLQSGDESMVAFPAGFRMLTGDSMARNYSGTLEAQSISLKCIDGDIDHPQTPNFPDIDCPDGLRFQVLFPSCWDGVNLDSPNHKSHVAYPYAGNNTCPSSHPVRFITLFYEVMWNITEYKDDWPNGKWPFVGSNGDPTGYGLHADFISGWEPSFLQTAINNCTSNTGLVQDCPQFSLIDQTVTTMCRNAPLVKEAQFGHLDNLPGCNPIQSGPAPATAQATCAAATLIQPSAPSPTTTFTNLPTPTEQIPDFVQVWSGINATTAAPYGWVGYDYVLTYDPYICAMFCLQYPTCVYFALYYELQDSGAEWATCQYYDAVWGIDQSLNTGAGNKPITNGQGWGLSDWVPGAAVSAPQSSMITSTPNPTSTLSTGSPSSIQTYTTSSASMSSSLVTSTSATPALSTSTLPASSSTIQSAIPSSTPSTPSTVPNYGNWSSMGCYTDSTLRTLTNYISIPGLTVQKCLDACAQRGFSYGGVENSKECYCDTAIRNNATSASSGCTQSCIGDSSEICGGYWRLNLYNISALTVSPPEVVNRYASWSTAGCYTEGTDGNALEALLLNENVTVESCLNVCGGAGYQYAGLENGSQCYCGNNLRFGSTATSQGCTVVCSSNYTEICGGPERLTVYVNTGIGNVTFAPSSNATGAQDLTSQGEAILATELPSSASATLLMFPFRTLTRSTRYPSQSFTSALSNQHSSDSATSSTTYTPFIRGRALPTLFSV